MKNKRGQLFILVLLIIGIHLLAVSSIYAQYENYESLSIQNTMSSTTKTVSEQNPKLDYFTINLSFFPKTSNEGASQQAENSISLVPEGQALQGTDSLLLKWTVLDDYYIYSVNSNIHTSPKLTEIKSKIEFPMQNIPLSHSQYLEQTEFIDITQEISGKALQIIGNEDDLYIVLFKLANWTQSSINYNLTTLTSKSVQKSSWVLEHREGVCDEITNLFISFARSLGIPARFVSGRAYSNIIKGFGNHGWAEVYIPEHGWVPYDVTFSQFGWIDASHIKFKTMLDPAEASSLYEWKGSQISMQAEEPSIITSIVSGTNLSYQDILMISLEPAWSKASRASQVPLLVTLKNNKEYYLPVALYLVSAPGLIGSNAKNLLLGPFEEMQTSWILTIPDTIEENTIYTSTIKVVSRYAESSTEIKYAEDYPYYSPDDAEEITSLLPSKKTETLEGVSISCLPEKEYYYQNETATIACTIIPSAQFAGLDICLNDFCKHYKDVSNAFASSFESDYANSRTLVAYAESEGRRKYVFTNVQIIIEPDIKLKSVSPDILGYNEKANIKIKLSARGTAKNISILIKGKGIEGEISLPELEKEFTLTFPARGKEFYDGQMHLILTYQDEAGKYYSSQQTALLGITDVPWYLRLYLRIKNLF
ncbi:transglutaminase domain-containing protein [archaeon]|nr:transglutaminase domain-containing protein [archaeon]